MKEWTNFGRAVASPWSTIFSLATVLTSVALYLARHYEPVVIVLTVLLGLFTSVLGGIWATRWQQLQQEGPLAERAKGAVRGLKLLYQGVCGVERHARKNLEHFGKTTPETDPLKIALDEVVVKAVAVEEQVLNAIEDWKDILPEANVGEYIGTITALKQNQAELAADIARLQADKEKLTKEKTTERAELERRIREHQEELDKTKSKLREKEAEAPYVLRGNYYNPPGFILGANTERNACENCGTPWPLGHPKLLGCPTCGRIGSTNF